MSKDTPLGARITAEKRRNGNSLNDLTVLAAINDPYRLDTPANHRDAEWLVEQTQRLRVRTPIHLRGLHYVLVAAADVVKPNGQPYINDDQNWRWLQSNPADAARWLGHIAWDDIKDERNEAPKLILRPSISRPSAHLWFDFDISLPDDIEPELYIDRFEALQPYQIILIGEKASLGDVLDPIAQEYEASLATPTGEMSDQMIHAIAGHMARDGRPAAVFYFSDCDPSGWQMPISVSRKLQAFRDLKFPDLDIQVYAAALTPDQVKAYGLPSSPLKEEERRGDAWKRAFGVEQTEIDALAALRPDLLRQIARDAIAPFYDRTLRRRCNQARDEYEERALAAFDTFIDTARIDELRERYETLIEEVKTEARGAAPRDAPGDRLAHRSRAGRSRSPASRTACQATKSANLRQRLGLV
jgi:hypothetical protein